MPKRSQKLILTGAKITYGYWPSKMTDREGGGMTDSQESSDMWCKYHPERKIEETPMWLVCLFGYIDGIRCWWLSRRRQNDRP